MLVCIVRDLIEIIQIALCHISGEARMLLYLDLIRRTQVDEEVLHRPKCRAQCVQLILLSGILLVCPTTHFHDLFVTKNALKVI